ncbi:MAG: class I SAM-dependent methyltransferase [Acidobacteriota bacterium]|nr:class I SAM-dependent methyltransferase [Acidobacteriota bacterium]
MKERLSEHESLPVWVRHEHMARFVFAATFVRGKTVVDCACGEGLGTAIFAEAGALRIHAFDSSPEAVEAARTRVSSSAVTCDVADGIRLPLADSSVVVFVSLETIEHIADDQVFLEEVRRVLEPDGVFICSTPNRAVTNPGTSLADKPWNPFHVREYDESEFFGRLEPLFAHVERYGQNPVRPARVRLMESLSRVLPRHGAVRLNQLLKAPRFLIDRPERHAVAPHDANRAYEYLVAVCRTPR